MKISTWITPLFVLLACASKQLLDGCIIKDDNNQQVNTNNFFDLDPDSGLVTLTSVHLDFVMPKLTKVKTVVVILLDNPTDNTVNLQVQVGITGIWAGYKSTSFANCGSAITYDSIVDCFGRVGDTIRVGQPSKISEVWAFIWPVYDQNGLASNLSYSPQTTGQLPRYALAPDAFRWSQNLGDYFETANNNDGLFWEVDYSNTIFITYVLVFARRGYSLTGTTVVVKTQSGTEQICSTVAGTVSASSVYLWKCYFNGQKLRVQSGGTNLSLYYVAPLYLDSTCSSKLAAECDSVSSFSVPTITLPTIVMDNPSPPSLQQITVYNNDTKDCCPVTWSFDSSNEITEATIDRTTQTITLKATAEQHHQSGNKNLKFTFQYFDGTNSQVSSVKTLTFFITCHDPGYKIDGLVTTTAFLTDQGKIAMDYLPCMQGTTTSYTITCDPDPAHPTRTDYVQVLSDKTGIQMSWPNRGTPAYYDSHSFTCHAKSDQKGDVYYDDAFKVNSVNCDAGLVHPNTHLSCGTQTINFLTAANWQQTLFKISNTAGQTITISPLYFDSLPASYDRSCGDLTYDITSTISGFLTRSSALIFEIHPEVLTVGGEYTVQFIVNNSHFTTPKTYEFFINVNLCNLSSSSSIYYMYYLHGIDPQTTDQETTIPISQTAPYPNQCNSLTFVFEYERSTNVYTAPKPSFLVEVQSLPPKLKITGATVIDCGYITVCRISAQGFSVKVYIYMSQIRNNQDTNNWLANGNFGGGMFLNSWPQTGYFTVYDWTVMAVATIDVSSQFPIVMTMSHNGEDIPIGGTNVKGLDWRPNTSNSPKGKNLGWFILGLKTDPSCLQNGDHNMVITGTSTYTTLTPGGTETRTVSRAVDWKFKVIDCGELSTLKDPSPIFKTNTGESVTSPYTVYFPRAVPTTLVIQDYSSVSKGFGNTPCDYTFTDVTADPKDASNSPITGLVTISGAQKTDISFDQDVIANLLASSASQEVTIIFTITTICIQFQRQLKINFVSCAQPVPKTTDENALLNTPYKREYSLTQFANAACDLPIKVRTSTDTQITYSWMSLVEGTTSIITVDNSVQPIASTNQGKYDLKRYVEYSPGKKFDVQQFSLYLCYYVEPTNNGVKSGQSLSFDKTNPNPPPPAQFLMDPGSITTGCSFAFELPDLENWMTWDASITGLQLNLASSTAGDTSFTFKIMFYKNANVQPLLKTCIITITILDACNLTLPVQWVSNTNGYATTFSQEASDPDNVYNLQSVTNPVNCGYLSYAYSAKVDSGLFGSGDAYLVQKTPTQIKVDFTGASAAKMTLVVKITIMNSASKKEVFFTINMYNCSIQTGTVTPLADAQMEVGEGRSFSMPAPQNYNNKCSNFDVYLKYMDSSNTMQRIVSGNLPSFVTSYSNTANPIDGLIPGLQFTLCFSAHFQGVNKFEFEIKNGKSVYQYSTLFKIVVCKTIITVAVIQPSAFTKTGRVFEFGRRHIQTDPKITLTVSYGDSMNLQACTYSGITLEPIDAAVMTTTGGSNSITLEVDSYKMTPGQYEIAKRDLDAKVWHKTGEQVYFQTRQYFTIRINDCSENLKYTISWLQQGPQFDSSIYQFEEATGPYYLNFNAPNSIQYTGQCGPFSYSLVFTAPSQAQSHLSVASSTGQITIQTPVNQYWGPEQVTLRVENQYSYNETPFKIQVFDCKFVTITIDPQDPVNPMVTTGPDWSYTWKPFKTSFPPCTIDTYEVTCEEGAWNAFSGLCNQGFQKNTSLTATKTAALRNVQINPLTIFAQYDEASQITVNHEGEFIFHIKGYSSYNPQNTATHSITVQVTTPCDNELNWITTETQTFLGDCFETDGTKIPCQDIHYTIFTIQENPIKAYNHRFRYSCTPLYEVVLSQNTTVRIGLPFISLLDSAKQPTTSNPAYLKLHSINNDDRDYNGITLSLRMTISQLTKQTDYKLYVYNDCSYSNVPMLNTGQTLMSTTFTVSQHLMQNLSYVNTISFIPPEPENVTDKKYCVVTPQDYGFKQLDYDFNPLPQGVLSSFNSKLFTFSPEKATEQISIHATSNRQVLMLLPNGLTKCGLLEVNTHDCIMSFEVSATALLGKNGTYPLIASGTVTFKSECFLLKEYYDLRWSQKVDSWDWLQTSIEPYIIREPIKTDALPRLIPLLPSIDPSLTTLESYSIRDLCGDFTYSVPALAAPFKLQLPSSWNTEPSLLCFSDDPEDADKLGPNFNRFYPIDLQVVFEFFKDQGPFSYNDVNRVSKLNYPIRDPCFGLSYTDAYITYNDGISAKDYNSTKLEVVQNSLWNSFVVSMPFQRYTTPEWGLKPKCGELNYTVDLETKNKILDVNGNTWLHGGTGSYSIEIKVFAAKLTLTGLYKATYKSYMMTDNYFKKAYLYPNQTSIVRVTIADCYIESFAPDIKAPSEFVFYFYGPPKIFMFPEFKQSKACNYNSTYNLTAYELINGRVPDYKDNDLPDPNPISFDPIQRKVQIETKDYLLVNKTYEFYITGYLNNPTTFQPQLKYKWGPFKVCIEESIFLVLNTAPQMANMLETYSLEPGSSQLVSIGSPTDKEGNKISLVEWAVSDNTITWVQLASTVDAQNLKSLDFMISPPADIEATFSINFKLRDNHKKQPLEASFSAKIQVEKIGSGFTFDGWQSGKSQADKVAKFDPPPTGLPQPISNSGGFSFRFDKAINLQKLQDMQNWNSTNIGNEYFSFELLPSDQQYYDENKDGYTFSWIVSSANETNIDFQFQFADYTVYSNKGWDRVRFKILKPEAFVSLYSNKVTEFKASVQRIPQQVKSVAELETLTKFKDSLDNALKTMSASSALNFLLSSSLQYLWGMINSMQVIVLTVLFNLKTPVNAQNIEVMILQMVSFDVIRTSKLLTKVFKFENEKTPPLNFIFEQAGYDTSNFILGMGPLFIAEVGYVLVFICLPIMNYICSKEKNKFAIWLRTIVPFQMLFRFYLEGTLELALNTLITFRKMDGKFWTTWQLCFSNLWAAANLVFLIVMPVLTLLITLKFNKTYHTDWTYRAKYDWVFEGLRGKHRLSALHHFFFIVRRYIITLCLIAMPSNTLFQIYLQVISSSIFFLYLIDTKPYNLPKQNKMELLNEFAVSVSCYFLFLFTDLVLDNDRRYSCGWALCLHLAVSIAINFAVVVYESVTDIIRKVKVWWYKRKLRNQLLQRDQQTNQDLVAQANNRSNQRSNNQNADSELNDDEWRREQERQMARPFDYEGFMRRIGAFDNIDPNNRAIHPPTLNEIRQRAEQQQNDEPDVPIIRPAYPFQDEKAPVNPFEEEEKEHRWLQPFSYEEFERITRPKEDYEILNKRPYSEKPFIGPLEPFNYAENQLVQSNNRPLDQPNTSVLEESKQIMARAPQPTKWAVSKERAIELFESLRKPEDVPKDVKQLKNSTPQMTKWAVSDERAIELLKSLSNPEPDEPSLIGKPTPKQESEYDLFGKKYPNIRRPIPIRTMGLTRIFEQPITEDTRQNDGIDTFLKELSSQPSNFNDSSFFESSRKVQKDLEKISKVPPLETKIQAPQLRISPYSVIKKVEAERQQFNRDASTGRVREVFREIKRAEFPQIGKPMFLQEP